jgi:hypothetical protein
MSRPNPSVGELAVCAFGVAAVFVLVLVAVLNGHDGWVCVSGCTAIGGIIGYLFRGVRNRAPSATGPPQEAASERQPRTEQSESRLRFLLRSVRSQNRR